MPGKSERAKMFACLAGLAVSGCLSVSSGDGEEGPQPAVKSLQVGQILVFFNDTLQPGVIELDIHQRIPCEVQAPSEGSPDPVAILSYSLFDRDGFVSTGYLRLDPQAKRTQWSVAYAGEPPFLFASDRNFCSDPGAGDVQMVNITDGFPDRRFKPLTGASVEIPVSVPPGNQTGVAFWTPNEYVWRLAQTFPVSAEGEQFGNITIYDSNGRLVREDHRGPIRGNWFDYYAFARIPGPYRIEVNLDAPAVRPTVWTYDIDYGDVSRIGEELCEYGFRWPGFCEK